MEILWDKGPMRAGEITEVAGERHGWKRNTVYTLISRLIAKGAVKRDDPGFTCTPVVQKDEVRKQETQNFLRKMYGGSINLFMKSFLTESNMSDEEFDELKHMIENHR